MTKIIGECLSRDQGVHTHTQVIVLCEHLASARSLLSLPECWRQFWGLARRWVLAVLSSPPEDEDV